MKSCTREQAPKTSPEKERNEPRKNQEQQPDDKAKSTRERKGKARQREREPEPTKNETRLTAETSEKKEHHPFNRIQIFFWEIGATARNPEAESLNKSAPPTLCTLRLTPIRLNTADEGRPQKFF